MPNDTYYKQCKDDFYNQYSYLKPECEKSGWENAGDWLDSAGEWCKKHWKEIAITIVIVVGAALAAIAAIICTGGMALAPILAAGLTALGASAGTAMTITTVTSLAVAGVTIASTLASSTLNIIGTWYDMSNNPTFKAWQTAMNWTSALSNGFYSIGSIYNSFKGISNASLREYSRNRVTNGDFRSAIWNADKFGLTLQPNSSNFWAGLGENGAELAERYAAEAGRSTLGQTLSEQGFNIDAITNWTPASASYAMNSSGSVAVNLGDDVGRVLFDASGREMGVMGNIWLNTERVLLNVNPNVTSIIINGIVIPRVFQWGSLFSGILSLGESVINAAN